MSKTLDVSRQQWEFTYFNLRDAFANAQIEQNPQELRDWLQVVVGLCDSLKAASVSYSAAVGYENRKGRER